MELVKEMKKEGFKVIGATPNIHCKLFEDNNGALDIASVHNFGPHTKHSNIEVHHFRDYVTRNEVTSHAIRSENQPADFLTKPLSDDLLVKHRKIVMGW
jgi:hypothetical protein